MVGHRLGRPSATQRAQGEPAEPERQEDWEGQHQAGQAHHRERADHQDEQGDREREERDREGPEALDQPACLDGELGWGGGFGACVHTSETKLAGAL
jgi:hypothetical protein